MRVAETWLARSPVPRRAVTGDGAVRGKVITMNKNTSPQARRSRSRAQGRGRAGTKATKAARPQSSSAARVASKAGAESKARRKERPTTLAGRIRQKFFAIAIPNAVVALTLVVVVLATVLLTSAPLAWLPTSIATAWFITNAGAISGGDIDISAIPLLPAIVVVGLISRNVYRSVKKRASINDLLLLLAWSLVIPLVLSGIAWFMLWDASKVYDVAPPDMAVALPRIVLLHLSALLLGFGPRLWKALLRRYGLPPVLADASRTAAAALAAVGVAAAIVIAVTFAAGFSRQTDMLAQYPNMTGLGIAALSGLSLLYLPNAVIGTMATLVGSEFHIGEASVSLFSIHLVPLPPLPLTAIIPASAPGWAMGLLVLPAIAISMVMIRVRPSFLHAGFAALFAGTGYLFLGYLATGVLGFYGNVGPMLLIATGLVVVWTLGIGLAVAAGFALVRWRRRDNAPDSAAPDSAAPAPTEPAPAEAAPAEPQPTEPAAHPAPAPGLAVPVSAQLHDDDELDGETTNTDEPLDEAPADAAPEPTNQHGPAPEVLDGEVVDEPQEDPEGESHEDSLEYQRGE